MLVGLLASRALADQLLWDPATLVLIQPGGGYARIARVTAPSPQLICCFEHHRHVCVRRSTDDGRTWGPLIAVAGYAAGKATNAELLPCASGRLLLLFNGRPLDGRSPFTIQVAASENGGASWTVANHPIYAAGDRFGDGCYEPAAVQEPSGAIDLFFANEHGHAADGTQAIDLTRSRDDGATWTAPVPVSYRAGGRDGMPVPILSSDGDAILLSIEDNGVSPAHQLQPMIERLPLGALARLIRGDDSARWPAVTRPPFPPTTYAGAPYLRQFLNHGPTVLSCQPASGPGGVQRLAVFLGDPGAHNFGSASQPLPVDPGHAALWNALFIKNPTTVTVISTTTIQGISGIWAIDGHLVKRP